MSKSLTLTLLPILAAGTWNVCPLGKIVLGERIAQTPTSLVWSASLLSELVTYSEVESDDEFTSYPTEKHVKSCPEKECDDDDSICICYDELSDSEIGAVDDSGNRLAIKYMTNCPKLLRGFPQDDGSRLSHEFEVMSHFNTSGITPHVYYLSEPQIIGSLDYGNSGRVGDALLHWIRKDSQLRNVICEERAQFRFQIMEKVGSDLLNFFIDKAGIVAFPTIENLRSALLLTATSVGLLKSLHESGWVHGDIHFGNIAFRRKDSAELVLIDLEKSGEIFSAPSPVDELNKYLLSPWQLEGGHPLAPRDDVVRLIHSLAYILDPESLEALVNATGEELIRKKRDEPVFNHSVLTARFRLDETTRIPEQLEALNRFVLDQSADIGPIDYEAIIETLNFKAHSLL